MTRRYIPAKPIEDMLLPEDHVYAEPHNTRVHRKYDAKGPRRERQLAYLVQASKAPIRVNKEFCIPYNKDLRELVAEGKLRLSREGRTSIRGPAHTNRTTMLYITDLGLETIK